MLTSASQMAFAVLCPLIFLCELGMTALADYAYCAIAARACAQRQPLRVFDADSYFRTALAIFSLSFMQVR